MLRRQQLHPPPRHAPSAKFAPIETSITLDTRDRTEIRVSIKHSTSAIFLLLVVGIVGGHRIYIHQYRYTLIALPTLVTAIICCCLPSFFFRMLGALACFVLVARWLVDGFMFAKFDFRKWQYKQYPVTHFEKRVLVTQGVLTREQAAELQSFDSFELVRNAHDEHDEKRRHFHWE